MDSLLRRAEAFVRSIAELDGLMGDHADPALVRRVSLAFNDAVGALSRAFLSMSLERQQHYGATFANIMAPFVAKSETARRCLEKPLGYAGDYETI